MIPFTDTHCHLDFDRFDKDRAQVINRAWKAGLVFILNPGIDLETSQAAISLSEQYPGKIYAAVGVHPNYGMSWTTDIIDKLHDLTELTEVIAIGEIGLDYYREHTPHKQQQQMLLDQLTLAEESGLPVVIHNRESTQDLLAILRSWQQGLVNSGNPLAENPGVLHSYSDDLESAEQAMEMNFYIGISGPVTFTNAPNRKAVTRALPLERILLETDAPFLAPHPHRGKRNEPAYIPLIAEEIARLHNTSPKAVAETTYANAMRLFKPGSRKKDKRNDSHNQTT
jgi:TatD DNase family protein